MEKLHADIIVDAKGLACPMPIVKTKKVMKEVQSGNVVEVQATDKGSRADLQAWAHSAGHQYLGTLEEGDVLKHFLRKATEEEQFVQTHPSISNNQELEKKLAANDNIVVLDVREAAEYAFNHIPEAKSIPLGDLDARSKELNRDDEIYVVCRTGSRSDLAAQKLTNLGFSKVINVVPGMSEWTGKTETLK
ncbi:sulfurtransferase TusA family protein [Radiobacillus sp. PE A8.2]|uniref:sulfurtransferase TusA family protein n=1 Tax=Radiobacillus sp. PE A8.2 TaxID=3380349 RepID=UPI00388D36C4